MPIHGIAALLEGNINYRYATIVVGIVVALAMVKAWSGGRKNTWARDWAGKMILVIAEPNPVTLELLHQLLHLPDPPQVLYLPPVQSPLSDELLTVLQTLRLSAVTKSPAAQLHCEALPRTSKAIRTFIKQWAVNPAGTGEGGRRLDAVVWADGWQLDAPLDAFRTVKVDKEERKGDGWTVRESRFHLLTALLPFLLKAPMERPIRLINLVSPFYAAAIPTIDEDGHTKASAKGKRSAILQTGISSWKDILLWKHLQKILDALASASHPGVKGVPVPDTDVEGQSAKTDPEPVEVIEDARRLPGPEDGQAGQEEQAKKLPSRSISVQSNILAVSVVMPFNRSGVVRPMLGFRQVKNQMGLVIYLIFSPIIYLFTPSNARSLQSVLFALQAPVLYDQDIAQEKGASASFVSHVPRGDGVRGGSIVRDCQSYAPPVPEIRMDQLGQAVWDDLQAVVEERLKVEPKETDEGGGGVEIVVPDDVYA